MNVFEFKEFGPGWLNATGALPVCIVQSPQPPGDEPGQPPMRALAAALDPRGPIATSMNNTSPLFIVLPEYSVQLGELAEIERGLQTIGRPWAIQIGVRPALGRDIEQWVVEAPDGVRRKAGWLGQLGATARYVSGVIARREGDNDVCVVMFLKNHFERKHESHLNGDFERGTHIVRVNVPGELSLFPLICADLTLDTDEGPRARVRKSLENRRSEGNRALVCVSLYEGNPASAHWDTNIECLLSGAPAELRLLLVNHASREGEELVNRARNRTGFHAERDDISEHVEAGGWGPWSSRCARGWSVRRTGPVLFFAELSWESNVRTGYAVRHRRMLGLSGTGDLEDQLPLAPLTHEGAYARHGLRLKNKWHPDADPAWRRSPFCVDSSDPTDHVGSLLHGISRAREAVIDTATIDKRWADFRRGLRVLAHLAAADDVEWDAPTETRPGQLRGQDGLSILVWCGGARTHLDAYNQLLKWSSDAAPNDPLLAIVKPTDGGFEHTWDQVVPRRGQDTRATSESPEIRIDRPRPRPVYVLALEAVENVLIETEQSAELKSQLNALLRSRAET